MSKVSSNITAGYLDSTEKHCPQKQGEVIRQKPLAPRERSLFTSELLWYAER